MITYYESGPMRSKPDHNRALFISAETGLADWLVREHKAGHWPLLDEGWLIINPIRQGNQDKPTECLAMDLQDVLASDVIVLLPEWEDSEGARREVELAKWAGKEFLLAFNDATDDGHWHFQPIDNPIPNESPRASALAEATSLITGDRNNAYGPPTQDFRRTADALTAFGYRHTNLPSSAPNCPTCGARPLKPHDTAITQDTLKTSRLMWTPKKRDSWVDKAGYSGCGYECAVTEDAA